MTFQKRLKKQMRKREMRVADLARWFKVPYTTMREWVLHGRLPVDNRGRIETRLNVLEHMS